MTAPLLPEGHGGPGTGRRGIFGWIGHSALPALFGGGEAPQEPGLPHPLAGALQAFGGTLAQSAGGPRRFGEFGPSALASVSAGLQAGHQVYQDAQSGARRRAAYKNVVLPPEGPTQAYWSQMLSTALDQNDLPTAREISSIIASGNYYRAPEVKAERPIVLREGQQAFDAQGNPIAAVAPRPFAPVRPTVPRTSPVPSAGRVPLPERQIRQSADLFGEMVGRMQALAHRDPVATQVDWNSVVGEVMAGASGSHGQGLRGRVASGLAVAGLTPNQRLYRQYLRTAVDHYLGALRLRATNQVMEDLRGSLAPQLGQGQEAIGPLAEVQNALVRRTRETAYGAGSPGSTAGSDAAASPGVVDPGLQAADDFLERRRRRP